MLCFIDLHLQGEATSEEHRQLYSSPQSIARLLHHSSMPTAGSSFGVVAPPECPVGETIPYKTPHAVSVSLPKWADNVDYEEGHQRIKDAMSSGYPRFYIHNQIDQVS